MRTISRQAAVAATAFLLMAAGQANAEGQASQVYQRTLRGTVWIVCPENPPGSGRYFSGSGWVVDRSRRLVITNHHVINGYETVRIFFPEHRGNKVVAEKSLYVQQLSSAIKAVVIDSDPRRDLALLQLEKIPNGVEALKLAAETPGPGDRVHSVGNPGVSDALWVYTSGSVRQAYRREMRYQGGQVVNADILETQAPINPGDSGGPVVNDAAEVVAVTSGFNLRGQELSYCIQAAEVKTFLTVIQRLLEPRTADDYHHRGRYYQEKKWHKRAVADFTEVLRIKGPTAAVYCERGVSFRESGDLDRALADFFQTIRLDPKNQQVYREKGLTFAEKHEFGQALEDLGEALKRNPSDALAHIIRGLVQMSREDYPSATNDFTEAIHLAPNNLDSYFWRANAQLKQGKKKEAIADCDEILHRNPKHVPALVLRGQVYLAQQQYDKAIADFSESIRLHPFLASAYLGRSSAYAAKGDKEKAEADRRMAQSLSKKK